uniref:Probable putative transmembrane protein n=1 Tax=Rheinheimera sp. BAL341 TaxID=1708203 RepID=A0A486XKT6_9GAMM
MQKTDVKNRFMPPPHWDASVLSSNPIFADLCQSFNVGQLMHWPDVGWLNQCATCTPVTFVDNDALSADGRYYEEYIYATGQVPTRQQNWHDFFGALIWCLFPLTKKLLNNLHMAEITEHGVKQRSKLRNKLTLFDECGLVICLEPDAYQHANLLRAHQWQHSFVTNRSDWWQGIRPMIFGHAMYEMATAPFIGLTAKALFVEVPAGFSQWPLAQAYAYVDQQLVRQITQGDLLNAAQLTPLPLLGVPLWYAANQQPQFYSNQDYFRPKRHSAV